MSNPTHADYAAQVAARPPETTWGRLEDGMAFDRKAQIAGLELERAAHLQQIAGLVAERDALLELCSGLKATLATARKTSDMWWRVIVYGEGAESGGGR